MLIIGESGNYGLCKGLVLILQRQRSLKPTLEMLSALCYCLYVHSSRIRIAESPHHLKVKPRDVTTIDEINSILDLAKQSGTELNDVCYNYMLASLAHTKNGFNTVPLLAAKLQRGLTLDLYGLIGVLIRTCYRVNMKKKDLLSKVDTYTIQAKTLFPKSSNVRSHRN